MRKNSIKNTRINGEVQKVLSGVIRQEINRSQDSADDLSDGCGGGADLKTCKAYISVMGDDQVKRMPLPD